MQGAGLGLFLRQRPRLAWAAWLRGALGAELDALLASFPIATAITPALITRQPGPCSASSPHSLTASTANCTLVRYCRAQLKPAGLPRAAVLHAGLGPIYGELLEAGACDERILTMLFLVVEKLRGEVGLAKPLSFHS